MENKLNVKVVFGSWKAYNECNDRALGSKWLDMSDFDSVEEIYDELKKEGFTDAELEETFIQDYEADASIFDNCDYVSISQCFEKLEEIDESDNDTDTIIALLEAGHDINTDAYLYADCEDFTDLAYAIVEEDGYLNNVPDTVARYFDYEAFGRDLSFEGFVETSKGILEIR